MKINHLTTVMLVLLASGCGESVKPPSNEGKQTLAPAPPVAVGKPVKKETGNPTPKTIIETDDVETAKVGVGKKGRDYGGGFVTEPIKQRFQIEDRLNFSLMEKALRDFKTINGYVPKSHEEFMKEVVKKNAIKLPELPTGDEYVFDPKRGEYGELMVRHRK